MFFNRFRIDREGGFALAQFALVTSGGVVDSHAVVLSETVIKENRSSLMRYLDLVGRPKESNPSQWKGALREVETHIADFITMSHRAEAAEICFYMVSMTALSNPVGGVDHPQEARTAQPVTLLRCPTEVQRELIWVLYDEADQRE